MAIVLRRTNGSMYGKNNTENVPHCSVYAWTFQRQRHNIGIIEKKTFANAVAVHDVAFKAEQVDQRRESESDDRYVENLFLCSVTAKDKSYHTSSPTFTENGSDN
jgi:hypothetical protein